LCMALSLRRLEVWKDMVQRINSRKLSMDVAHAAE